MGKVWLGDDMLPRSAARNERAVCPLEFELGSSLEALLVIAPRPPKVGDSRGSKDKFCSKFSKSKYILAEGGPAPQENSPQENERTRAIVSDPLHQLGSARGRRLVVGQCHATCKCAVGSCTSAILPRAPPEKVFQGNFQPKDIPSDTDYPPPARAVG